MAGFEQSRGDSSLNVETPEGIEFTVYPAGLPIRACAWAIDILIQGALLFVILIISGIFSRVLGVWFLLILIFALDWFYHMAFEIFCRGQSPGKRLMGIRVVRVDGSPINPGSSFLRNLLRFADTFMFLNLIAFICMLVSPGFRRFGDWAADTLVVYTDTAHSPGRFAAPVLRKSVMTWLVGVPMVSPSRKFDYEEKQALLSFARRYPLLGKARADEIADVWVDKLCPGESKQVVAPNSSGIVPPNSETEFSASSILLGIAHTLDGAS